MVATEPAALKNQQLTQARSDLGTFWHRARSKAITKKLVEVGASDVVDVGAGAGNLGGWLAANRPEIRYRFLEPMTDLSDHLSARFGASNRLEDIGDMADIESVDAITLLDVLEHIDDDHGFLDELFHNLPQGGSLFLTVPAYQWLFSAWDTNLGHHRRYGRAGLRHLVESVGFEVSSATYLFPELVFPAVVRKLRGGDADGSAEFPELPNAVDRGAYAISSTTAALDRLWPFGTSILLAARKP